jgi:uncharacterized protein (DUF58 family)
VIPTRRLFIILGILALFGAVAGLLPTLLPMWLATAMLIAAASIADVVMLRRTPQVLMERTLPASFALGVWTEIALSLRHEGKAALRLEVFDRPSSVCATEGMPVRLDIGPNQRAHVTYRVRANARGDHRFETAHARFRGKLGLFDRQVDIGTEEPFRVLPNFKAVSRYTLLAAADQAGQLGIRQIRRRGSGMEFDHLREYREGDLIRQVDWKATARRQTLISREYQDERDQQIVLMLDCGGRMRAHDGELTHFDHVLNAALLLSHVALRQGDAVSVGTFGGQSVWIPRQRGPQAIGAIVDRLYDLQTTTAPSDFVDAARKLASRQHRRSLVMILTNLYDTPGDDLLRALSLLRARHLVVVASLREPESDAMTLATIDGFEAALRVSAAHEYLRQRTRAHQGLIQQGAMVLDVTPADLSVQLVNRYLEVKRAGLL